MVLISFLLISLIAKYAYAAPSVIGGVKTGKHELGYEVSIQVFGEQFCSGGIIEDQFVITAAHCLIGGENVFDELPLVVVAGTNFVGNGTSKEDGVVEVKVIKAYVPAIFNGTHKTPVGDIAVLKLERKLKLGPSSKLTKLNLPPSTEKKLTACNSYVNNTAIIAGFGWDKIKVKTVKNGNSTKTVEEGSTSGQLLKAKALVVSNKECQKNFVSKIHDNQLCAKIIQHPENVHQGVCAGDSGSPLVYNKTIAIGTVSFNRKGCNDSKRPGVYTRVSSFISFIKKAREDKVTKDIRSITF